DGAISSPPAPYHLSAGGRWIRTSGSWSRDRQTVMGEVTAFSKPGADLLGIRRFESISLQRRVLCEPTSRAKKGGLETMASQRGTDGSTPGPPAESRVRT